MKTVKINRAELLTKVKENREKHVAEFKEAWDGYVSDATAELKAMLREAKNGKIKRTVDLVEPRSFEENYDRIIAMLEWSTDETVDLDHNEFEQYVRDNWQWKQAFALTTALYNSKVAQ